MTKIPYVKKQEGDIIQFFNADEFIPATERQVYAITKTEEGSKSGHPCFAFYLKANLHDGETFFEYDFDNCSDKLRKTECDYDEEQDIWFVKEGWFVVEDSAETGEDQYYRIDVKKWMEKPR
jgi:hypothetical protein